MIKRVVKFSLILLVLFFMGCDLDKESKDELQKEIIGIPGDVKITQIDNESIKVTWSGVDKATGYEVAFAKEGEIWSFASASETNYTFSSLKPGTYQAKVRALLNSYNGDFSKVVNFNLTVDTSSYSGIFSSGEVNVTGTSGQLISDTIEVTGINLVNELIVRINVDHDLLDFCDVSLESPDGTSIYLSEGSNAGIGKDYVNTVFDDKAETYIIDPANKAPYTGSYKPESNLKPLSTFKGKKADGTWTLRVYDEGSGYSFAIKSWDLAFNGKGFSMEGADDVVKLTLGQWSTEEIEAGVDSVWFSADVTPGKEYIFNMDEGESGEGSGDYSLNTKANIYTEDKDTKVVDTSSIWKSYSSPVKFTAPAGVEKIFIEVYASKSGELGDFAIKVNEPEPTPVVNGIASSGTLNVDAGSYSESIHDMIIEGVGTITEVKLRLNVNHEDSIGKLQVKLQSPDAATPIELSMNNGGWGENYVNTVFDDDATDSITTGSGTFTGSFKPEQPLSTFDGGSANGKWKLIFKNSTSFDATLVSWDLAFNGADFDGNGN